MRALRSSAGRACRGKAINLTPSTLKTVTGIPVLMQTSAGSFIGGAGLPIPVTIQDSVPTTQAKTS